MIRFARDSTSSAPRVAVGVCLLLILAVAQAVPAAAENITPGPDGNVWFTEPNVNAIGRITPDGAVSQFMIPTPDSRPSDITAGPEGKLWFSEQGASQIGSVTVGGVIGELSTRSPANGIALGADGDLWFARGGLGPGRLGRLTPAGDLRWFPIARSYTDPTELALGPEGDIWFIDRLGVAKIAPDGTVTRFKLPSFQGPADLASGPDGAIWLTLSTGDSGDARIGRVAADGALREFPVQGNSVELAGITAGPDGAMWFTDGWENQIRRISLGGTVNGWEVPHSPGGIAAGADGNLWFTEEHEHTLGRITPQGVVSEFPIPAEVRCIVPELSGRTLPQAVKSLRRAHCRLGRVRKARHRRRRPRVVRQQPYPTAVYPADAKVSLTLR